MKANDKSVCFLNAVKKTIMDDAMIQKGDTVILGLSGGADSVCLFTCLERLSSELGFSIVAAHVNHGLRGKDSDMDEEFVRRLCKEEGVPLFVKRVDLTKAAKGQGTEAAGRSVRYAFFRELAGNYKSWKIATAHNKNDLAETVIMRLIEGTSLSGLNGIPRCCGGIIRPLIDMSRSRIEEFLAEQKKDFVTDKTNFELTYTRNRVRHVILPAMEKINPKAIDAVARLAKDLGEDEAFINKSVPVTDSVTQIRSMDKSQSRRIIAALAYRCGVEHIEDRQIRAVMALCEGQSGKSIDLPGNFSARREFDRLVIEKKTEDACVFEKELSDGENHVAGYNITIGAGGTIDREKLKQPLIARPRRAEDRIFPKGMDGSKSVRKLFIEKKIPAKTRASMPVIVSGGDVVFAADVTDRRFLADKNTKETVFITITNEKET